MSAELPRWNPGQYLRFAAERELPFRHLMSAIENLEPTTIADLGCGAGGPTMRLARRWPGAAIWGVDRSGEMLERARALPGAGGVTWVAADLLGWRAPAPLDLIVSNATFHWIPDHAALLDHLARQLAADGTLAFQVPNNFAEPSHRLLYGLCEEAPWRRWLARISHRPAAVARDTPALAAFSRLRVLQPTLAPSGPHAFGVAALTGGARGPYAPPSPTPRPSGRKRHHHRRLARFASRGGEKCGLAAVPRPGVRPPQWYRDALAARGFTVTVWEATYHHLLAGEDPVLEWVRGSTLRPIIAALPETDAPEFLAEYGRRLRSAYPAGTGGTVYPFHRIFVVATRQAA